MNESFNPRLPTGKTSLAARIDALKTAMTLRVPASMQAARREHTTARIEARRLNEVYTALCQADVAAELLRPSKEASAAKIELAAAEADTAAARQKLLSLAEKHTPAFIESTNPTTDAARELIAEALALAEDAATILLEIDGFARANGLDAPRIASAGPSVISSIRSARICLK
ncbi:hypothetical protein GGR25_001107 [Kaistia hirudinis]|uniref:Uncharacterized protein n=1 Tax=Kaistia hirudinis TaxID=1293440 RepID=A0A840AL29_9HYPH|nr:hypothetical protein [Kaistia hirudinis]MBB3930068.1 hypothetical protein [Kaistia hirudinis]